MNNIILSVFNPSQTAIIIAVAAVGVVLIALNIVLAYIFNKRGERKLHDLLLQQQRELLMQQLEEMHRLGTAYDDKPADIKPFFMPADSEIPVQPAAAPIAVQEEPEPEEAEEAEEPDEEAEEELAAADFTDDESVVEEEVTVIKGRVIRYNRSFSARIIQATDELKERYSCLKNYILSFKNVKGRVSWKKESFRLGRSSFATLVMRGKTLCLCLATDPKKFEDTKYKVIDLSVRSPKSKQPCMYRISAARRVKYAMQLIDLLMEELGAVRTEDFAEQEYKPEYRTTQELIECGLIKVTGEEPLPELEAEVAAVQAEQPPKLVEPLVERDFEILEEVYVEKAEEFSDEQAEQLVEIKVVKRRIAGKRGIVNLDSLSRHYEAGDYVTVEGLRSKGIIAKDVQLVKILAKGSINKPLIIEADDFSLTAVKMIVLTGGRVIRRSAQ